MKLALEKLSSFYTSWTSAAPADEGCAKQTTEGGSILNCFSKAWGSSWLVLRPCWVHCVPLCCFMITGVDTSNTFHSNTYPVHFLWASGWEEFTVVFCSL